MSELKAMTVIEAYQLECNDNDLVYLKSEADKVIAELEERIADGDKDFEIANNQNERLLKIVRHHKYKRCVELADSCAIRAVVAKMENRRFPTPKNSWRMFIYPKWHKRWLAIAEKFKTNSTLQQKD